MAMEIWPNKTAAEVFDYSVTPLDPGDTIATSTWNLVVQGGASIAGESYTDTEAKAFLTGGTPGETVVLRSLIVSTGGRTFETIGTIQITDPVDADLGADETFATLAEADAYAMKRDWTDWAAASTTTRRAKLRESRDYIVTMYRWPSSYVVDSAQLGPWPRQYAYDREGRLLTGTPDQVKAAQIEAARVALTGPLLGKGGDTSERGIKSEKIAGVIETTYDDLAPADQMRVDRLAYVDALLKSTGASGGSGGVNVRLLKS